ncbi:MAG: AtpZ/AtpI family protein [Candidatus Pacebacteria bacterium]|nr:AtpZ/AtpI family protein [Candidatus Paceibacterota bacterium]
MNRVKTIFLGMKVGLLMALPLVGFLILGVWIDKTFMTSPTYLITGILGGIVIGGIMVYKIIIPYLEKKFNNK